MSSSTATAGATKVKWLGGDYPPAEPSPPKTPLKDMLVDLRVLEKDGETPTLWSTPPSVQVITAGGTALVKFWAVLVAAGFGGGALAQGLKALDWLPGADAVTGMQTRSRVYSSTSSPARRRCWRPRRSSPSR